jgi:putative ABC transport system permease protein
MMLPRLVIRALRIAVPADRVATVLADLEDDYRQRRSRGWLAIETTSLLVAYSWAFVNGGVRRLPLIVRDAQLVLRGLRRGLAAFAATAALLGVGIAALLSTAGLSDVLLLRQVSATHGNALRRVAAVDRHGRMAMRFSFSEVQQLRAHVGAAGEVASVYLHPVVLTADNTHVQTMAEIIDGAYFALTGVRPILGRTLLRADDRPNAPPVAVLAEPFWRRHWNASPSVLGREVRLNGAIFTVIGIVAATGSSSSLGASVDAWVTASHADPLVNPGWRTDVRDRWFSTFVLPAHELAAVDGHLATAAHELERTFPEEWRERRLLTIPATVMSGSQRTAAVVLTTVLGGLSVLILIAAASNAAGVLVARATVNQRAAAIHVSVGAGRGVIIRRQLMEGALLGFVAGLFAIGMYAWVRVSLAEVSVLPTLALRLDLPSSPGLLGGALATAVLTGILIALGPALWSTRLDVVSAFRNGSDRATEGGVAARARRALAGAQVCLSLVLVVAALMFIRSSSVLTALDLGFSRDKLVALDFDVEPMVPNPTDLPALAREALDRVGRLPVVGAAAMSNRAPVDLSTPAIEVERPGDPGSRVSNVSIYHATEDYFDTVGLPVVHGRAFTRAEVDDEAAVVILNESLASQLWPDGVAIDRAIIVVNEIAPLRVVGVARDSKYRALTEASLPHIYRPTRPGLGLTLLARGHTVPSETLQAIQRELDMVGPGIVGFFPRSLDDHLAVQLLPSRAAANAASVLGTLALALSTAALYSLVSWFVLLRHREIGVRMALGASSREIRELVVRQAVMAAWPGLAAGLLLALGLAFAARSALHGVSPVDPVALGGGIALLIVVVLVAGYLPSRAATKMDPLTALRQ